MTGTVYQREAAAHASDASFVATIISGVVMILAVIVQITAIAVPLWGVGKYIPDSRLWDVPEYISLDWIRAVQAFEILGLLCGLAGVIIFALMLSKSGRIWSQNPLETSEKGIVAGYTAALFMAGLCTLVAYSVITKYTNQAQGISPYISLFSCILFLMGSCLSGSAATDIILYRK